MGKGEYNSFLESDCRTSMERWKNKF